MTYRRVIPRDLFNEANLLKCYGQLYIAMERLAGCEARFRNEDVPRFEIMQRESDGAIFVYNLPLEIGRHSYTLTRPLNSRRPWPLYAERDGDDSFDPIAVFDDQGELTPEMRALLGEQP